MCNPSSAQNNAQHHDAHVRAWRRMRRGQLKLHHDAHVSEFNRHYPMVAGCRMRSHPHDNHFIRPIIVSLPNDDQSHVRRRYESIFVKDGRQAANLYLAGVRDDARKVRRNPDSDRLTVSQNNSQLSSALVGGSLVDKVNIYPFRIMCLWAAHAPDKILLGREQQGLATDDDKKSLKRARRARWAAIKQFLHEEGVSFPQGAPDDHRGNGARYNRLISSQWWDKQLFIKSQRANEQRARVACRVGAHANHYITDDCFDFWMTKQESGQRFINDTVLVDGYTEIELSEVVKGTTANPTNRFNQLLTQIKGMVDYAEKHHYQFVMITPTAASEHHPSPRKNDKGDWVLNPKYDSKWTAKATHNHLNDINKRVFAALKREGIDVYGFKSVEPHKDGCPHWHMGLFYHEPDAQRPINRRKVKAIFNWYFLECNEVVKAIDSDDGDGEYSYSQRKRITFKQGLAIRDHLNKTQVGAIRRRVTYKYHDQKKGTLSNYIVKGLLRYVVKGIGALMDEEDGKQTVDSNLRGAAWASLNGIRQYSVFGTGAAVGVYQELRRLREPVEGSVLLELERKACIGTYGTPEHDDEATKQDADFCAFMELRRKGGYAPVKLLKGGYKTEQGEIAVNQWGECVKRVEGLVSEDEDLEIVTRVTRWKAVNVNHLEKALVESSPNSKWLSRDEVQQVKEVIAKARESKKVHRLAEYVYKWREAPLPVQPLAQRSKPRVTWKIRNNYSFSTDTDQQRGVGNESRLH